MYFPCHSCYRCRRIPFCKLLFHPRVSLVHVASNSNSNLTSSTDDPSSSESRQRTVIIDPPGKCIEATNPDAPMFPEWLDFMDVLLKRGYFEDTVTLSSLSLATKDNNSIRAASLNYARLRADLLQSIPKNEVKMIARYGCPTIDKKVVNSGKRLRAYAGISEDNACGSCNLRGECERAYANAREDEPGRTVDLIRIILSFIFTTNGSKLLRNNAKLKESVRNLLREIVQYDGKIPLSDRGTETKSPSLKQGDWICSKCSFHNFAKNIRCLRCNVLSREKVKELQKEIEHLPLKRGDWICATCNFFNFARNTKCFICKETPSNRKVNPGEWECESCHYINFRRNVKCLKCDYNRAKRFNVDADVGMFGMKTESKRSDTWSFVEDKSKSTTDEVDLPDFPVCGGFSSPWENMEKKEKLRNKMSSHTAPSDEEKKKMELERRMKYVQCSDSEEPADWFTA